jgi:endogenous inhibitor of DNA gyrase (YacG/DUF329 family)
MNPTIDEEQVMRERIARNNEEAKSLDAYTTLLVSKARGEAREAHRFACLVCGRPMQVQRRSKKTCSSRCRLKLSRWTRAYYALPKAEIRKREAELNKRWRKKQRQARAAAKAEEERISKQSREEVMAGISAALAR